MYDFRGADGEAAEKAADDQREFVLKLHHAFTDARLVLQFQRKSSAELEKLLSAMSKARDQQFTYWIALDSNGKGYEWLMVFLHIFMIMASPVRLLRQSRAHALCRTTM